MIIHKKGASAPSSANPACWQQDRLHDPLALKILAGKFREGETIRVDKRGASLQTCATSAAAPVVDGEVVE